MGNVLGPANAAEIIDVLACLEYRSGELREFLDQVAQGFSRVLGVDWTVVTLIEDPQRYRIAGNSSDATDDRVFTLHGSVSSHVVEGGAPYWVNDATGTSDQAGMPDGFVAYLGVPLKVASGEVIGTVCSFDRAVRDFSDDEVAAARVFAARAAAAIDQYRVNQALLRFNAELEQEVERRTADLRNAQQQLIRRERLAAVGELAARIVHEVRSPLSTMTMALDHMHGLELPHGTRQRLSLACDEAERLRRLLAEILSFSTPGQGRKEAIDVDAFVARTLGELAQAEPPAETRNPLRKLAAAQGSHVLINPDKLRQVLINLISNAREAAPPGTPVVITSDAIDDTSTVRIRVHNQSFDAIADLERVLEPFVSNKPRGTGLGLPIVRGIVEALNGSFSLTQAADGGVTAEVRLPVIHERADAADTQATPATAIERTLSPA
ncbi:MAG: GAF domain-containing sensor histidine kinase [Gammaproteobacteria bacterium]|nr:GAF domain-containing sensor histidine kinase [Gammaproteobacteria bacterium]